MKVKIHLTHSSFALVLTDVETITDVEYIQGRNISGYYVYVPLHSVSYIEEI